MSAPDTIALIAAQRLLGFAYEEAGALSLLAAQATCDRAAAQASVEDILAELRMSLLAIANLRKRDVPPSTDERLNQAHALLTAVRDAITEACTS